MKIIKPGREQKGWSGEFKCTGNGNGGGGCGAVLLVEYADLYYTESHCRDETNSYITFKCCACGVETDLTTKEEPHTNQEIPSKATWQRRQRSKTKVAQSK